MRLSVKGAGDAQRPWRSLAEVDRDGAADAPAVAGCLPGGGEHRVSAQGGEGSGAHPEVHQGGRGGRVDAVDAGLRARDLDQGVVDAHGGGYSGLAGDRAGQGGADAAPQVEVGVAGSADRVLG